MTQLVDVALPVPLFRTFTYAVPQAGSRVVPPGTRVVVPFRREKLVGIVTGAADPGSAARVKARDVLSLPDESPVMDAAMLELATWISSYYAAPLGLVLRSALPAVLTGASDPTPSQRTRRVVTIREHIPSLMRRDELFGRARQQRALYELLESLGGRASVEHLLEQLAFSPSVLKALEKRGLVEVLQEVVSRDPFVDRNPGREHRHDPTAAQREAIAAIRNAAPGSTFLLHGVTGSGKTLVYLEVLREVVLRRGQGAIVLVPEIALTPQTVDRFRSVFGDRVAVLHSALSDGERYDAWLALQRGERQIAVGARSAIFAPVHNLGAVIVDEEHESSYKQSDAPRYHAREVAVVRARLNGAVCVLGSATPSLESWVRVRRGRIQRLALPNRAGAGRLPKVDVVDLRASREEARRQAERLGAADAAFRAVIAPELELAIADRLDKSEQSILLLNRRGYSAFVQCRDCGNVSTCPNCSISLTYHRLPERLVCHYCQYQEEPDDKCPRCAGRTMRQRGLGTQQVERLVCERYPSARVARMDVDTTSGKWAHAEILDRVGRGEVDVLLGTQMIAKGLDFPNVTLVGVIDADVGINLPDFRASERCFQLLSQVAGRAGRGEKGGRVIIQTRTPDHHAVRYAVSHDYDSFVEEELRGRESPRYPPMTKLANVVVSGTVESETARLADDAAEWLRELVRRRARDRMQVVGAAPCALERIKNRWRWHMLLRTDDSELLSRVSRYLLERFEVPRRAGLRVVVDRDPVSLL